MWPLLEKRKYRRRFHIRKKRKGPYEKRERERRRDSLWRDIYSKRDEPEIS